MKSLLLMISLVIATLNGSAAYAISEKDLVNRLDALDAELKSIEGTWVSLNEFIGDTKFGDGAFIYPYANDLPSPRYCESVLEDYGYVLRKLVVNLLNLKIQEDHEKLLKPTKVTKFVKTEFLREALLRLDSENAHLPRSVKGSEEVIKALESERSALKKRADYCASKAADKSLRETIKFFSTVVNSPQGITQMISAQYANTRCPRIFTWNGRWTGDAYTHRQMVDGSTPLFVAVAKGDISAVEVLKKSGANLHWVDRLGRNAIEVAKQVSGQLYSSNLSTQYEQAKEMEKKLEKEGVKVKSDTLIIQPGSSLDAIKEQLGQYRQSAIKALVLAGTDCNLADCGFLVFLSQNYPQLHLLDVNNTQTGATLNPWGGRWAFGPMAFPSLKKEGFFVDRDPVVLPHL